MLSAGRTVGQMSRITRYAHPRNLVQSIRHPDFVKIVGLRYSSKDGKKNRTAGSTATVEECVPTEKPFAKVPPLQPPPPPPIHAQPQTDIKPPQSRRGAPCDDQNYSCPPNCTPYEEPCYKSGGPSGEEPSGFKYWKHLLAALILSGLGAYAYLEFFSKKKEKYDTVSKKKDLRGPICKNPKDSKKIPSEIPYLLIGGGTAAFSAFRSLKASDPTAKILMINAEGDIPYMRPPLSKELWYTREETPESEEKLMFKQWNGTKRSLYYEPKEFYTKITELKHCEKGGVAIATGWTVKKIDVPNKTAYLEDGYQIKFDKCLLAVGANPKNLEVFEKADPKAKLKILPFRTKRDYLELKENLKNPSTKNIVVIGGGFLGSELSSALIRNLSSKDQKVYQIFKEKNVLAQVLPEYLSEWTTKRAKCDGIDIKPEVEVHDCELVNDRLNLALSDGSVLQADQVIVALGVEVDKQFAMDSNLEIDPEHGGYLVNAELEARSNVWVAGDAACFYDVKLGRRRIEHHDHAVVSGRLVGENMTGARKPYLHQSMFWSDLGPKVGFEAIGIIDSSLETVGVFAKASEQEKSTAAISDADKNLSGEEHKLTVKEPSSKEEKDCEDDPNAKPNTEPDDYAKGVVFYIRDKTVVGIVLWNMFNRMSVARQLLARGTTYDELNEAAKLFAIHED